jgi:hypothetical protein
MLSAHNRCTRPRPGVIVRITGRLLAITMCLGIFAVVPAMGQAEYSDAYSIDDSGQTYDSATDTVYVPDSAPHPLMVGIGMSEDSYDSVTYSTSTYTTITSPDGRSVSGYADGYVYARAEAIALELDPQTSPEGDYTVNSEHTYYREQRDPQPCDPSGICYAARHNTSPHPQFLRASLGTFAPQIFFIIRRYTYAVFFARPVAIAYRWANTTAGCEGDPNRPFAYLLHCPNAPAPCARARVCASAGGAFVQGFGTRIHYGWGIWCHMRYPYYAPMPWCSP